MIDPSKLKPREGGLFGRPTTPFGVLAVRSPAARIIVLIVLLLLVIAGMVGLIQYAKTPAAREGPTETPAMEVPPLEVPTGVPPLDMTVADHVNDYGAESRREWPADAIRYLLLEAANTPAVYAYAKNLVPLTPGSAAEIDKDSRPWRFKYVRFRGELEYMREEDYEAVYGTAGPPGGLVWRGRVRVDETDPPLRVVFVTVTMPMWADTNENTPRPEAKLIEDGWVRGRGILVKNYIDAPGGDAPALLVVATEIERDFAAVPVKSLDDVPFDIIRDSPSLAVTDDGRAILAKEYPRALYRLVAYADGLTGAPGAQKRAAMGLKAERIPPGKAWEQLVGKPEEFRTKYFGGLGVMVDSPLRYVPETITPNDAGVEECINGWIFTDEQRLLQFIAPASLDAELRKRTRVRWEGFFYKTKLYAAQNGTERFAPVFVLTVLDQVKSPKVSHLFPVILAGSLVIAMMLLAYIVLREDRTKESYRRIRQRKIAADRAAGGA